MLRSFVANLLRSSAPTRPAELPVQSGRGAGAVVFVANVDGPVRITPQAQLYSDRASVRMRAFTPMRRLAARCPVYLIPAGHLAQPDLEPLEPVGTVAVTKFTVNEISAAPATFDALIANLARMRGRVRLFADLCDNYAALGDAHGTPVLRRYQEGLAANCVLTVPCAALAEELGPIAAHGVQIVEDPFESPRVGEPRMRPGDPVQLCWFGSLGTLNQETVVQGLKGALAGLEGRAAQLDFVTHEANQALANEIGIRLQAERPLRSFRYIPWSLETTWRAIDACDFVILPQEHHGGWGRVKSHNRLVETIRGGRLGIASPIPSYLELGDYAWVGEDLGAGIAWALAHPDEAVARVRAGQQYVDTRFSPERIAGRWEQLLL